MHNLVLHLHIKVFYMIFENFWDDFVMKNNSTTVCIRKKTNNIRKLSNKKYQPCYYLSSPRLCDDSIDTKENDIMVIPHPPAFIITNAVRVLEQMIKQYADFETCDVTFSVDDGKVYIVFLTTGCLMGPLRELIPMLMDNSEIMIHKENDE